MVSWFVGLEDEVQFGKVIDADVHHLLESKTLYPIICQRFGLFVALGLNPGSV